MSRTYHGRLAIKTPEQRFLFELQTDFELSPIEAREILETSRGILGAKRRDILMQFLVEAMVLSGLGGAVGVLVGWSGAQLLSRLAGELLSILVTPGSVFMALGVSLAIGLFFGIYSANRAARLDPIEALGHE